MATPVQWGHVAQHALAPYHVRSAARRAYAFVPSVSRETFARRGARRRVDNPTASFGQAINLMEISSPGIALYRHAFGAAAPPNGEGAPAPSPEEIGAGIAVGGAVLSVGVIAAIVALSVAINYQLGKAMAPNKQVEGKWAWGNAIGGTVFPPFTLGMAVYKNYFRD
jgi:hypothetical protein